MIKAVLFDFGGVIYEHPKAVIPHVIAKIYNILIEPAIEEYKKYRINYYLGRIPTDELITSLSATFNSNLKLDEVKKLWLKNYGELAKPNHEVLGIIKSLRKNYKVYLFSNTTEMSNLYNSKTEIYDNFDGLFMSYKFGMKKPNIDFYNKVLSIIKFKPQECLFIDDDIENLKPAKELGMKTILFNILTDSPIKLKEELKKLSIVSTRQN